MVTGLASGSLFMLALMSFWRVPNHSLNLALISGTTRCSRLIMYIFCQSPKIQPFSKEPSFLLAENGIWKPRSGYQMYAHFYRNVITSRLSQSTKLGNELTCSYISFCYFVKFCHYGNFSVYPSTYLSVNRRSHWYIQIIIQHKVHFIPFPYL